MRRRLLPATVLLMLTLALVGAATAPAPHQLPAVALGAVLVWRVEIATIVFAAVYSAIVVTRLALHGETLTRVGRDGIEIPRVGSARAEDVSGKDDLATSIAKLQVLVARLGHESGRVEDPSDVVLHTDGEGP
jgi:hypothetical protein